MLNLRSIGKSIFKDRYLHVGEVLVLQLLLTLAIKHCMDLLLLPLLVPVSSIPPSVSPEVRFNVIRIALNIGLEMRTTSFLSIKLINEFRSDFFMLTM